MQGFSEHRKLYAGLAVAVVFAYWVVMVAPHIGKTRVEVTVAPFDSQLYMNGAPHEAGTLYLKPGKYTFIAKRSGFANDRASVDVRKEAVSVALIPAPQSSEAFTYLQQHPSVQAAREALGSQRTQAQGLQVKEQTPLITQLPYTDVTGPFTINYGPSTTRSNGVFLLITDSSPHGRVQALKWIRQQGYDPTDFEIRYGGFVNPLQPPGGGVMRRWIMVLLSVIIILLVVGGVWYKLSLKTLTVNYRNAHEVTIYKTAALDSGKARKPLSRISASGQSLKLRGGSYTLHYVGNDGYESRYVPVEVTQKQQVFSIDPEYSEGKLKGMLEAELPSIKAALTSKYPGIGAYDIQTGKLYDRGEWYATVLNYKGSYGPSSDSLRLVMHKDAGRWSVKTDPPNITLSKFIFPDVPVDILKDVNSFPVANVTSPPAQRQGSGGAHPRY